MQLILNTDADIVIRSNMSVIEQKSLSLDAKITDDDVTDKMKNITEINTSKDLENSTDNAIETDNNVVNGKDSNSENNNGSAHENNQELSCDTKEEISKEEKEVNEVGSSNKSDCQNDKENDTIQIKEDEIDTSQDISEESEVNIINQLDTDHNKKDNNEDECDEIESNLHKSDDEEINENTVHELNVTKESNSNTTADEIETQVLLDSTSENVSCQEDDSSLNECESEQQHEQGDSEKARETEINTKTSKEKNESDKQDNVEIEFTMRVKNVTEINDNCINTKKEDEKETKPDSNDEIFDLEDETDADSNQTSNNCVKNEEVIDIADEKDDECVAVIDDKICDVEKVKEDDILESEKSTKSDIKSVNQEDVSLDNKTNDEQTNISNHENLKDGKSILVKEDKDLDNQTSKEETKEIPNGTNNTKEKKPLLHISKLSNTLDILSDDDDEDQVPKAAEHKADEKQCINIEDDDDIMLIDEETSDTSKNNSSLQEKDVQQNEETKEQSTDNDKEITMDIDENSGELRLESNDEHEKEKGAEVKDEQSNENIKSAEEKPSSPAPLIPVHFFKSCKKNFAEMTREELEEFCVLKIVESVVDRSNLSEMNVQLKTMSQSIEDYKKRTITLIKQNRDLQVVLKSIQEEQKKNSKQAITPLKITRSVGMQVLMIETPTLRKKPGQKISIGTLNPARSKNQSPKTSKGPSTNNTNANNQQIPVPRLVPAVNNSNNNKQSSPSASPKAAPVPNGVRSSPPVTKPEKRSFNKMQQGNSVTVDLTDDEPPSKVVPRNIAPPVRLIPQQSLLTAQRPQLVTTVNSPRKVYIPIGGSQNPVRPGQTIMLKQVPSHVPRMRGPGSVQKQCNSVRLPRIAPKHPAPLPDCMKQYQPPNWKALPPKPELKLSKVENGIVISWKIDGYQEDNHEEIASYQLYAYQETTSPPSTTLWKKIGDVKALPLPMACTLTQFMAGYKYYFAVRAVDVRSRLGPFSLPGSILLLNKM